MKQTNSISREEVERLLQYDPETGIFVWIVSKGAAKAGSVAGTVANRGYVRLRINRREFLAQRIAWLLATGHMPTGEIDHINGDRADNRLSNLRPATHAENGFNRGRNANNTSGFKGVHRNGEKFSVVVCRAGKHYYFGVFDVAEDAHAAYCEAFRQVHGEFGRSS